MQQVKKVPQLDDDPVLCVTHRIGSHPILDENNIRSMGQCTTHSLVNDLSIISLDLDASDDAEK